MTDVISRAEDVLYIADLLTNEQMMENYKRKSLKRAADFDVKNIISQWIELIDET